MIRVHLSDVFAGRAPAELALATRDTYQDWGVDAHFGDPVVTIERSSPAGRDKQRPCF